MHILIVSGKKIFYIQRCLGNKNMKITKIIASGIGFVILTLAMTVCLWYGYPQLKLSMFLSGDGEAELEFLYATDSAEEQSAVMYSKLSAEPEVYEVVLNATTINTLRLEVKKYQGTLNIADVFLNGKNLRNLQIENSPSVSVINNSANNLSVIMRDNAQIEVCQQCYPAAAKVFKPFVLCSVLVLDVLLMIIIGLIYRRREHIKEKMLTIYTFKNYALIMPYMKPYWGRALLAICITMPVGAMDAVIAWSLKPFMDVVLIEKQSGWTMYIPVLIIVFSILQALFTYVATYMNSWVGNKVSMDVKHKLFNKLLHNDAAFFDKTNSGDILFYYNSDIDNACSGLLNNLRLFATRFFSSVSLICVLLYNSWQLAIIAIIVLFGALYPLTRVRKRLKKVVTQDANAMATMLTRYNEAFSGNRIITAYNLFDFFRAKFVRAAENVFDIGLQMVMKTGVIAPAMHVISSLGIAFVIWFGSYLIVSHQITIGNFASFITSLVMLYNPIKSIGNNYNAVIMSLMAVERVFSKMKIVPAIRSKENAVKLNDCKGNIEYENVSFAYVPKKTVLKNINLEIKAGQTIALVGNSGGGKTTISALLPRFYEVTSGAIKIDGIDIRDIDLDNLRSNIGVVFQDNFLFGSTIRENILFDRTDVSEEELRQAIHSACLDEFIAGLEKGLDTAIGERGVMISGGQKQRIAIARAFIKNAPILILDEATSALDNKSEAIVQQAIDNLMQNRTVLVIAHRLSTVRNADKIVVINNGNVVEQGTHDELLAQEGEYAALYKTQLV